MLCYGIDKYYLVGGEVILSLYRALGSIPTILQGNLNIQVKENLTNIIENKEYLTLLGIFVKFICNDLKINIPKIKIINNPNYTENNNSYGGYDPIENQIYVVIYERTLADSMRSLCHECYHAYQNSKGILNNKSGEDGSKEENAANSYAGKIMRIFGRQHPEIFFMKCGLDEIKGNKLNLQEGIYGDYLFGDKESGVRIKWYDKELEEDTPAEKELFTRLKAYADSEFETYSNMNIDDLKPLFDKLKIEYPDIANPNLQGDSYIYRGTTTTIDKLEELKQLPNISEDKRNIIIPNQEYSSQRQLSSWSTNYFNAASFAIATAERKGMVPLIVRAKVKDAELYFNPEFMNKLSSQPEEEVLNSTNPINVDVLIIKGFDTELYDDEYLDEIKVNQPITRPVIGKIYDIVTWYAPSDIGEIKDYNYEPYGETINGEEGWYWSKGWKWEEDNTDRELKWIDIYDPWNTREYNINEIIRLNKDNLSEIKINPISIKFPIIINSLEEFDKIKPLFIRGGYKWCNGQIIIDDLKNECFPRKFYIRPGTDKNICSDYLGRVNEEKTFSKDWWKEVLDLDEIKINKPVIPLKAYKNPSGAIYLLFNGKNKNSTLKSYINYVGWSNKNNSIIYFGLEPHIKKDFTNKLKQKGISYVYDEDGLGLGIDIKYFDIKPTSKYSLYDEDINGWYNKISEDLDEIKVTVPINFPITVSSAEEFKLITDKLYKNGYRYIWKALNGEGEFKPDPFTDWISPAKEIVIDYINIENHPELSQESWEVLKNAKLLDYKQIEMSKLWQNQN